jgi:hypothetical protein
MLDRKQIKPDYQHLTDEEIADIPFTRLRRITGYLVGDRDTRFNDAKLAEERDRVKHDWTSEPNS